MIERHQDEMGGFGHGFTMSGHPVAAAAALANIDIIEKDDLLGAVKDRGALLLSALREALDDLPYIADIRGAGLLVGIQLLPDRSIGFDSGAPGSLAITVAKKCLESGLVFRALPGRDTIAMGHPLIVTKTNRDWQYSGNPRCSLERGVRVVLDHRKSSGVTKVSFGMRWYIFKISKNLNPIP